MPFDKPPAPPAAPVVQRPHRSPAPYIVAALIFVLGLGSFAVFLFQRISGTGDKLTQIIVPGGQDVTLSEPGEYTIFHEYHSVIGDEVFSTPEGISGLQARVTDRREPGENVELSPASSSSTYDIAGRSGRAIFEFTITTPGTYYVEGRYASGEETPKTVLAVGKGFVEDILVTVFLGIAIMFGSITLSIAITVVTFVKRRREARS